MIPMSWRHLQNTSACTDLTNERKWMLHEPLISNSCQAVHTGTPYRSRGQQLMNINTSALKEKSTSCSDEICVQSDFLVVTAGLRVEGNMAGSIRLVLCVYKQSDDQN
jgi:hypothetical protein